MQTSELENYRSLKETQKLLAEKEAAKINSQVAVKEDFMRNYYIKMDKRNRLDNEHIKLLEGARNNALSTAIKAIYITALEAETLTDEGLMLAENMVDKWIAERGGATKILEGVADKSHLLYTLSSIVEEAAEEAVKEIEKDELTDDKKKEDDKPETKAEKKEDAEDSAKDFIKDASKKEIKDFMSTLVDKITDKVKKDEKEKAEKKAEEEAEAPAEDSEKVEDKAEDIEADAEKVEDSAEEVKDDAEEVEADAKETEDAAEDIKIEDDAEETEDKAEDVEADAEKVEDSAEEVEADAKETEDAAEEVKDDAEESEDKTEESEEADTEEKDEESSDDEDDIVKVADMEVEADEDSEAPDSAEDETAPDGSDVEGDAEQEDVPDDLKVEDKDGDGKISSDEVESDTEEDLGEPLDKDGVDADTNLDGEIEDNKEKDSESKMFEELEDEEDVQKAIEVIRTRVADAEETFIRNNAEDKKKMDELLNKISNNVKAVTDLANKDPQKAEVAKENAMYYKSKIHDIQNDKEMTIYARMSRILTENILKNEKVKDQYINEEGRLDVDLVMETVRVMYTFLETLNTTKLENVNEAYLAKVLNEMKLDK